MIFVYKSSYSNINEQKILKYLQDFDSLKSDFIQITTVMFYLEKLQYQGLEK